MNIIKPHFRYNKRQRNGVLFLVLFIVVIQVIFISLPYFLGKEKEINQSEILFLQKQIDSLKQIELSNKTPKIYPFNPNYITDFKGYQLGMTVEEIDRLLEFRKQNKFVNSAKEFQQVTKVSDSLLNTISPYFKFPDWATKQNQQQTYNSSFEKSKEPDVKNSYTISTTDLNKATAEDLQTINGVGEKLSNRIIQYRKRLQGYSLPSQLYEVWYLEKPVADKILNTFKITNKPVIKKVNLNTTTFKELLKNPYIDYELCKKIVEFRDEVAELQDISELKQIEGFPTEKYERIVLYLEAK